MITNRLTPTLEVSTSLVAFLPIDPRDNRNLTDRVFLQRESGFCRKTESAYKQIRKT